MLHLDGPLCSIDVGDRASEDVNIHDVLSTFIGGRGVGTKLAHDRIPFDADPLGPENRLYFATGPLQHARMSFTGRMSATGLSPLTNGLLSSNAGGFLSRNVVNSGYSAIEITGSSDTLLIIHVTDEAVTFQAVPELAEATTEETCSFIERTTGLDASHTVTIGPAGENGVRFASIMTSESRAFGRGGLGAVLGAKGVKAITFDGDTEPSLTIPDMQTAVHREAAQSDHIMKRQGTTSVTSLANEVNALPTRYFSATTFEGASGIDGDRVEEKKYQKGTCSACAFACKLPTKDEDTGLETEGPEYETVMAFGSNAGVDDIVSVMQSNELCDQYGLDTISCGDVISAYLASEDAFGDSELIHELVEKIAYRDGIGDLLAEGVARAHDALGVDNWSVKGMAFSAHDGRTLNGQGLGFATSNRGADHMYAEFYALEYPLVPPEEAMDPDGLDGKAPRLVSKENVNAVKDSAVLCKFSRSFVPPKRFAGLLKTDVNTLQSIGERIVALERHFNNQRGFDRADDTLPYADQLVGFDAALSEYYAIRGWRDNGTVPESILAVDPHTAE